MPTPWIHWGPGADRPPRPRMCRKGGAVTRSPPSSCASPRRRSLTVASAEGAVEPLVEQLGADSFDPWPRARRASRALAASHPPSVVVLAISTRRRRASRCSAVRGDERFAMGLPCRWSWSAAEPRRSTSCAPSSSAPMTSSPSHSLRPVASSTARPLRRAEPRLDAPVRAGALEIDRGLRTAVLGGRRRALALVDRLTQPRHQP